MGVEARYSLGEWIWKVFYVLTRTWRAIFWDNGINDFTV